MIDPWLVSSFDGIRASIKQGRKPHSIIISGDPNLGTAKLAILMAKLILCNNRIDSNFCNSCHSCAQFADLYTGSHPDFNVLLSSTTQMVEANMDLSHSFSDLLSDMGTPLENSEVAEGTSGVKSVRVNSVRKLCEWVNQGSVFGFGKVAVISNANLMGEAASNALLKTFEEPPEDTCIILLTKSFDALPATLLSRAIKIQVPRVSTAVALNYLQEKLGPEFDKNRAMIALELASNTPLGALKVYKAAFDTTAVEIINSINDAVNGKSDEQHAVSLLLTLSNEDKSLILQLFIRDLLKYKARVSQEELPLLAHIDLHMLCKLPADHLFKAYNDLVYISAQSDAMLPPRAPNALLSAWINALRKK